jgi:hypothetical protein
MTFGLKREEFFIMEEKLASQTTTSGYAVSPAFAFQPEVRSTAQEWQWNADPYSTGINVTTASYRAFFPLPPQTPHFKSSDNLPQHKKEAVPYCGSEEVAAHNYVSRSLLFRHVNFSHYI